jgi:ankyrin repeat protein
LREALPQRDCPEEAAARYADLVRFLLDHGSDAAAKDKYGSTTRDLAQSHEAKELVALLSKPVNNQR